MLPTWNGLLGLLFRVLKEVLSPPLQKAQTKKVTALTYSTTRYNKTGTGTPARKSLSLLAQLKQLVTGMASITVKAALTCVAVTLSFTVKVTLPFPNYPMTTPEIATLVTLMLILKTVHFKVVRKIRAPKFTTKVFLGKAAETVQHPSL